MPPCPWLVSSEVPVASPDPVAVPSVGVGGGEVITSSDSVLVDDSTELVSADAVWDAEVLAVTTAVAEAELLEEV